ncbi:MAG: M16 family metallopeptidase [Pyrinomonadaceae bacterium]
MKTVNSKQLAFSRFLLPVLLILSFALAGFAQESKASLQDQIALVSEFDVGGLKVLVKRRPNMATVSGGLFVRGGARNLTANTAGIENFMLEAATEGSKKYPRKVLRRETSSTGGGIGAGSNNDFSVLSIASTRKDFDKMWDIFTDVALNPTFAPQDVERVRARILTGLREQETSNDSFLNVLQDRIIYANHPYANDVNGTIETVTAFKPADLKAYHKKMMETSRLLLVIVGDIDANELQKKVAATLGKMPRGKYKEEPFPAIDFSKPTVDITERALPTNYIKGVFNAPSLSSPDYYAMRVAIAVLQSRVYSEVRLKRQLSYAPNAELDSNGANTANIYVTTEDANQSVDVMLDEVENLRKQLINEKAVSGIAGHFLTLYYMDQETNAAQARELGKYELIGGGWRNAFTFLDKVKQVTPEDVRTVSQKYMKNIRFIVIGDPASVNKDVFLRKFGE